MINLEGVIKLQNEAGYLILALDRLDITDHEEGKEKAEVRSQKAEVSRQLLELADLFSLAESVVRNEYWIMKGRGVDIEVGLFND